MLFGNNKNKSTHQKALWLGVTIFVLAMIGCDAPSNGTAQTQAAKIASLQSEPTDVNILAKVNDTPITKSELALTIKKTLGDKASQYLNQDVEKKILDSLVGARAMALMYEKEMADEEKQEIETLVAIYREELLVKRYVSHHATPEPVTQQMVQAYYEKNLESFGGEVVKNFEYITTTKKVEGPEKTALEEKLAALKQEKDWQAVTAKLKDQGYPVKYKTAEMKPELLEFPLQKLVKETSKGETSAVLSQNGELLVVRINETKQHAPKALTEVSNQIRKSLAPIQIRKAVQSVSQTALAQVNVSYVKQEQIE